MTFVTKKLAATASIHSNPAQTIASRLRAHLRMIAPQRLPTTYQQLAQALRLTPPNTIHLVSEALEHLMAEDAASNRPFIAALVISKARGGLPAAGFFDCAARLGRFNGAITGPPAEAFHAVEFNAAASYWAASGSSGKSALKDRQDASQASPSKSDQET